MYLQPYGDEQQLNLNWIINEIINLHKQLDPDYETPSFTQVYPYSNLNRLNLDWVLSELKALKELTPEPTPTLDIQAVAKALVALPFDSNTSYQIYDFISKDGEIWRATEAISAGGEWDETKWFKTKIGTDLAVLERWINAINNSLTSLQNTVADLSSADISDDSDAGGATVKASLNNLKSAVDTLDSDVDNLTSADISDDSNAGGATVKASLNNLKGSLNTVTPFDTKPTSGSTKGVTSGGIDAAIQSIRPSHNISFTPSFTLDPNNPPTIDNIQFAYTKVSEALLYIYGRFRLYSKNTTNTSTSLSLTLPDGFEISTGTPASLGYVFDNNGITKFVVRPTPNYTSIFISKGAAGAYSMSDLAEGNSAYYVLTALIPIEF